MFGEEFQLVSWLGLLEDRPLENPTIKLGSYKRVEMPSNLPTWKFWSGQILLRLLAFTARNPGTGWIDQSHARRRTAPAQRERPAGLRINFLRGPLRPQNGHRSPTSMQFLAPANQQKNQRWSHSRVGTRGMRLVVMSCCYQNHSLFQEWSSLRKPHREQVLHLSHCRST